MVATELNAWLFENEAAPEGVVLRDFPHGISGQDRWIYDEEKGEWIPWSPTTNHAQAMEMAERLNKKHGWNWKIRENTPAITLSHAVKAALESRDG